MVVKGKSGDGLEGTNLPSVDIVMPLMFSGLVTWNGGGSNLKRNLTPVVNESNADSIASHYFLLVLLSLAFVLGGFMSIRCF